MKKYLYIEEDGETKAEELSVGGGGGFVFITNVTSVGNVGDKIFAADTVPVDTVLESCTVDTDEIEIHFLAEGSTLYSPVVSVGAEECGNLTQLANDVRVFTGSITTTVLVDSSITISSSSNQTDSIQINKAPEPPEFTDIRFVGGYPGSQSEVKNNDSIDIQFTFDMTKSEPTSVTIQSGGVCDSGVINLTGYDHQLGVITISRDVASSSTTPTAKYFSAIPKNALGSEGSLGTSTDNGDLGDTISSMICNDRVPGFTDNSVTYPGAQSAFKDVEVGSKDTTVSYYTSVAYTSPNSDFTVSNDTTYEQDKTITCTNPNSYNDSVVNFRITALRAENDTTSVFNNVIEVADTAPHVTISQEVSRLRSSAAGATYWIRATSDQNLYTAPDFTIPVSGTWDGSAFTGGTKIWSRDIVIDDADSSGSAAWTVNGTYTNGAGITGTVSGNEVVGGFVSRNLTLEAFMNEISVDVEVTDYSKLRISTWSFTDANLARHVTINTSPPVPNQFTIDAISTNPHTFRILDTNKTNASSQATTVYSYEEQL